MSRTNQLALAVSMMVAVLLLFEGVYAQPAPDSPPARGGGLFHSLSPEQRMMLFVDLRKQTSSMNDDQRTAFRHSQRDKFAAMTEPEKRQFAQTLQSEWDALPSDQKDQTKQQMQSWRAERMQENATAGQTGQ